MVDSHFGQPNTRLLPSRISTDTTNPQPNPQPSFADFTFSTIGRAGLLKRFTTPDPRRQYHSPTPEPEDNPMETDPTQFLSNPLLRPTLLEALADDMTVVAKEGPAGRNQNPPDVGADSDMPDDFPLSDDIAASAAVPPRLERHTRSHRQAPLSPDWGVPPARWQAQNLPTTNISTVALPQTNGMPTPSSPSLITPVTGHESSALITDSSPSAQETLASSSNVIQSPVTVVTGQSVLPITSHPFPSLCATTTTASSNNFLQHANLQHLQTRILTSLSMLIDTLPPTPSSTPLEASSISLALRIAHSAAQSSIAQADRSVRAAESAHSAAQSLIHVGKDAFSAIEESLAAAQASHVAAQRSCEIAQESFSASNVSLSDANEARRKADEAMRAIERVGHEIRTKEENIRVWEEEIKAREERVKQVAADTKEVVEAVGIRVRDLRDREIAEGEERRKLELDAMRRQLEEQVKGAEMEASVAMRAWEKERRAEGRRDAGAVFAQHQRKAIEDADAPVHMDQDMIDFQQEAELEKQREIQLQEQRERDAEETARKAKEKEALQRRDREREEELRKEQEKKRAEVMAQKQRANQEAGAKIRAEREAKERAGGGDATGNEPASISTVSNKGPPISPRKMTATGMSNGSRGTNVEFGNVVANKAILPDGPKAKKASGGQGRLHQTADWMPATPISTVQPPMAMTGSQSQSSKLSSIAVSSTSRAITSEYSNKPPSPQSFNNFTSGTTQARSPVSGAMPFGSTALAADKTSRNFTTYSSPSQSNQGLHLPLDSERDVSSSEKSSPSQSEASVPGSLHWDSGVEMDIDQAPQEVNIRPAPAMSFVAQATNLRHLTNSDGVTYSMPTVTVKKESHEGVIEPIHASGNPRIGGVTVLPKSPAPPITSRTHLQASSTVTHDKYIIPSPRINKPHQGTTRPVKPDPDATHVVIPPLRDNSTDGNGQVPSRTDVAGRSHSNSSSGRNSDVAGASRNDTHNTRTGGVVGLADPFSQVFTEDSDGRRVVNRNEPRPADEPDVRRSNESRVPISEDRRIGPGNTLDKRFRTQKRGYDYYSTQDEDYERSIRSSLPTVASRAIRGYDHWSPSPHMPRLSPSPPPLRKRAREDNSWSSNAQSLPERNMSQYEDSSRERSRNFPRAELPAFRHQEVYDSRSYRPVRSPSPRNCPPMQGTSRGYTPSPDDAGTAAYFNQREHQPQIFYQDSDGIGNSQLETGYSQYNPSSNAGTLVLRPGPEGTQTVFAPATEKIGLLSRLSDKARPPPVGPSRGVHQKRGAVQPRGFSAKVRGGRGGRSLQSRIANRAPGGQRGFTEGL